MVVLFINIFIIQMVIIILHKVNNQLLKERYNKYVQDYIYLWETKLQTKYKVMLCHLYKIY